MWLYDEWEISGYTRNRRRKWNVRGDYTRNETEAIIWTRDESDYMRNIGERWLYERGDYMMNVRDKWLYEKRVKEVIVREM